MGIIQYKFFQRKKNKGETVGDYVAELKNLAIDCKFGNLPDDLIREQFVIYAKNAAIKERLWINDDSLEEVLAIVCKAEISRRGIVNNCGNRLREDGYKTSVWFDDSFKERGVRSALQEEHVEEDVEERGMEGDVVTEVNGVNYDVSGSVIQEPETQREKASWIHFLPREASGCTLETPVKLLRGCWSNRRNWSQKEETLREGDAAGADMEAEARGFWRSQWRQVTRGLQCDEG
ncbi:hypothetical protein NDU88_003768 [Pleurodeles waltl]|uniref:Retrotransposon gag domain-containing protein n=1 Tax=Pleurodeles waltl TaxID=8319 RepID=A0AAV7PD13_PLEWA|nr:hypothetical protein NDU88_003768 [Pleurodeles waltl]